MSAQVPVLFVESYPQASAGQQETLLALLARCDAAGISPTVATPDQGVFVDRLGAAGHPVKILPQPGAIAQYGGAVYRYGRLRKVAMAGSVAAYVARLRHEFARGPWRAVFCNDLRGLLTFGLAARLAGVPTVIWDKLDRPHGIYDALQLPLASKNLMIADCIGAKYPGWQRRLWADRMVLNRNGIDTARIASEAAAGAGLLRASLGLGPDTVVIGLIGSITPRKGQDVALQAMKKVLMQVPQVHLAMIGAPPPESAEFHSSLVEMAVPQVHWLGHRADVARLLGGLDILISPSRHEGLGRVNIEAMAAGVPVIGTTGTGIAEVVRDGETGFLVPAGDAEALASRIIALVRDGDLRRRMGAAGKLRAGAEFEAAQRHDDVLRAIRAVARA